MKDLQEDARVDENAILAVEGGDNGSFPEYVHGQCAIRNAGVLCHVIVLQVERRMLSKLRLDLRQHWGAGAFQPKRAL